MLGVAVQVSVTEPSSRRKAGISEATYYNWRKKYAGLMPSEMKRLKQLEDENGKLRKLVLEATKQCGAAWAPEVRAPVALSEFITRPLRGPAWLADPAGNQPSASLDDKPVTVTIVVKAPQKAGSISNTAKVTSDTGDPNAKNDSDTETTTVATSADLSVTKKNLESADISLATIAFYKGRRFKPVWSEGVQLTDQGALDRLLIGRVQHHPADAGPLTDAQQADHCGVGDAQHPAAGGLDRISCSGGPTP